MRKRSRKGKKGNSLVARLLDERRVERGKANKGRGSQF